MVGDNERGEPIVEVRSVRMVLRGGSNYFSRLVTCTNCGREVPGLPVTNPADLELRPGPYVCTECVEALRAQGAPPAVAAGEGAMEGLQARIDELAGRVDAGAGWRRSKHGCGSWSSSWRPAPPARASEGRRSTA
jgi:hypothetical protein